MNLENYSSDALRLALNARSTLSHSKDITLQSIETVDNGELYPTWTSKISDPTFEGLSNVSSQTIFDEIRSRQKAIYGDDDRIEVVASNNDDALQNANSTAAIVHVSKLSPDGASRATLSSLTISQKFLSKGTPLCQREPFQHQPAPALGTAFLVSPTIVATAGHCINSHNFHTRRFIFDFQVADDGSIPLSFSSSQIYGAKKYIDGKVDPNGADWALVELDRAVVGRTPLSFRMSGKIDDKTPLYVIGHPLGLPKKIAANAEVRSNSQSDYFVANLDTYGGNSGSPVINANTHTVEGILIRGQTDFAALGDCIASLVCPITGCRGEDCNRMQPIADHIAAMM